METLLMIIGFIWCFISLPNLWTGGNTEKKDVFDEFDNHCPYIYSDYFQ